MVEYFGGLVGIEVGDYDGLDLWVFVMDYVGYGMWFYLFQVVQVVGVVVEEDVVDQVVGFVFVEGLGEYFVDVVVGIDVEVGLVVDYFDEFVYYLFDLFVMYVVY